MKLLINIFFVACIVLTGLAQEKINVPAIDQKTYALYLKKDWKNLIKTGKKAERNGINFYYLDYRMGIAYFELKKYMKAIKYFEKLYAQNPKDATLQEYLYLSYLYAGRYSDARVLSLKMNPESKKRLNIRNKNYFINSVEIAGLYDIIENYEYKPDTNQDIEQKIMTGLNWYGITTEHLIDKENVVKLSFSQNNITYKNTGNETELQDNNYENLKFNQIYFLWNKHVFKGTDLLVSGQLLTNTTTIPQETSMQGRNNRMRYESTTDYNFIGFIGFNHSLSIFNLGIENTFSNLNNEYQIQPAVVLTVYPFANTNFFLKIKPIYLLHIYNSGEYYTQKAIQQSLGLALSNKIYFTTTATIGEMKNFTDFAGLYVNNNNDLTKLRLENLINIRLGNGNYNLYLMHRYGRNKNFFLLNNRTRTVEYNSNAILIGFKLYIN